jgi:hypothetical protein
LRTGSLSRRPTTSTTTKRILHLNLFGSHTLKYLKQQNAICLVFFVNLLPILNKC